MSRQSVGNAVEMYATSWCGYCARARQLFIAKGVSFTEIDVEEVSGSREEMQQRGGRNTVPQIFIGGQHIGGYDDLRALDTRGELDPLLAAASLNANPSKDDALQRNHDHGRSNT
jgi:glutaredoxin 3